MQNFPFGGKSLQPPPNMKRFSAHLCGLFKNSSLNHDAKDYFSGHKDHLTSQNHGKVAKSHNEHRHLQITVQFKCKNYSYSKDHLIFKIMKIIHDILTGVAPGEG